MKKCSINGCDRPILIISCVSGLAIEQLERFNLKSAIVIRWRKNSFEDSRA